MKLVSGIVFILTFLFSFQQGNKKITRMNQPSIRSEVTDIIPHIVDFNDTIPGDTLFAHINRDNVPVKYSRNVVSGVCIDGECRLVKINLFWDITGRYLGFELPKNEYLSKTKHDPFNLIEYNQLHELLDDPHSALAGYSINELVSGKDSVKQKADAISSATIAAILDYIVEGAVYTTYTLWHITYGPTKREIEKFTQKRLNSNIVLKILGSDEISDKVWALNHIPARMEITPSLEDKLVEIISGNDVYLAERSLNALKPESLDEGIQLKLAIIFTNSGFLQKRLILQKLMNTESLNYEVVALLSKDITNLNGTLLKNTLSLFKVHNIKSKEIELQVAELLKNENRFIANQAYTYLESIDSLDNKIKKSIERYKRKNL